MPPTSLTLAMSTSWNADRHLSAGPMLDEILAFGIRRVELANVTAPVLGGLAEALATRGMAVQSIHNPCPWPVDSSGKRAHWTVPDALASPGESERSWALGMARGTIELAARLGARAVIVHLGRIDLPVSQDQLMGLVRAGRADELAALRERALADRRRAAGPYVQRAIASARELGECAAGAGIALGVEVRDGYHEIPSLQELGLVFDATAGLPVCYWHDTGHVEKQRLLGLGGQEEFLARYGDRLLGVHLHDAVLGRDHLAPGCGQIDLVALARLLPAGALRTLELHAAVTPDEVRRGIEVLAGLGLA